MTTAYEYLIHMNEVSWLPPSIEGHKELSNGEIKRWLKNRAVLINGTKPDWDEEISIPVNELVFFPKGNRRTSYL